MTAITSKTDAAIIYPTPRSLNLSLTQASQRFIGIFQRKGFDFGVHGDSRRQRQEFFAVAAREIGDRADRAFFPEKNRGKKECRSYGCRRKRHVRFADGPQSLRNKPADGREDDCRIEFDRWQLVRTARPNRAQIAWRSLRFAIARPGKGVDLAVLIFRDLGDDVGGGAKAIDSQTFTIARFHQAAVADQTGAQ